MGRLVDTLSIVLRLFNRAFHHFRRFIDHLILTGIGAYWFNRLFLLMVISFMLGGLTRSTISPFSGLPLQSFFFIAIFVTISAGIGFLFSGRVVNDTRISLPLGFFSIGLIVFYLIFVGLFGSVEFVEWQKINRHALGYSSIFSLCFWGGVLSGNMRSPPWMGNLMFKQHVLPKLDKRGVQFMLWDKDGNFSILDNEDINFRWDEEEDSVKIGEINLDKFSLVIVDEGRGNFIKPGIFDFNEIKSSLSPLFLSSMEKHFELIVRGYERFCWLNLLQLVIPRNPSNVSQERDIFQSNSTGITCDGISYRLSWPMPESLNINQAELRSKSVLSHWLGGQEINSSEGLENRIVMEVFPRFSDQEIPASRLLMSITHLIVVLRHEMDISSGSKREQCRRSIIDISQFFVRADNEILSNLHDNNTRTYHYITMEKWVSWIDYCLTQPATIFLRLHNLLTEEINQDSASSGLKQILAGALHESTNRVIQASAFRPKETIEHVDFISSNFGSELGNNRTIAMLSGVWRMLILCSLIRNAEEVII